MIKNRHSCLSLLMLSTIALFCECGANYLNTTKISSSAHQHKNECKLRARGEKRKDMEVGFQALFARRGKRHLCRRPHSSTPDTARSADCDHRCWTPLARNAALCQARETTRQVSVNKYHLGNCREPTLYPVLPLIRKIWPLSSDRQHLSYGVCLEVRGEIIRTFLCWIVYDSCAQS